MESPFCDGRDAAHGVNLQVVFLLMVTLELIELVELVVELTGHLDHAHDGAGLWLEGVAPDCQDLQARSLQGVFILATA